MKTTFASLATIFALTCVSHAAPIAFPEISLLVRMGDSESYISEQVTARRLLRSLTPDQEARLKTEGAPASLLQKLRNPATTLSTSEADALDLARAKQQQALEKKLAAEAATRAHHEAARAAIAAAWTRAQAEKAAYDQALAQAAVSPSSTLSLPDYAAPYYAPYPYQSYTYQPYGYGYPSTSVSPHVRPGAPASFSLQWQNGTATTYTAPGLSYHSFGTNGASSHKNSYRSIQRPPASHNQRRNPDGQRFGR